LSWSRRHHCGAATVVVEPPPLSSGHCHCCGATAVIVDPPSLLSHRRHCGAAAIVVESPLLLSRHVTKQGQEGGKVSDFITLHSHRINNKNRCRGAAVIMVEELPLLWSRHCCHGATTAAAVNVEPPLSYRCHGLAATIVDPLSFRLSHHHYMESPSLPWSRCRWRGVAAFIVIGILVVCAIVMELPLLLSLRWCHGAAIIVVETSSLPWSRHHCKAKKKKTKTKTKTTTKTKTKKKMMIIKKPKNKPLLHSCYNTLNESATSVQSPYRHGMCFPKSPTRYQPHPTSTSADTASNKRYRKPD